MSQENGLTQKQITAIELLITGRSITETSGEIKTSRETVSRWVNHDFDFQAEINQRRKDLWGSVEDRLRALLPKALEVLEAELEDGDKQTAQAIVRFASIAMKPEGNTNADILERSRMFEDL